MIRGGLHIGIVVVLLLSLNSCKKNKEDDVISVIPQIEFQKIYPHEVTEYTESIE